MQVQTVHVETKAVTSIPCGLFGKASIVDPIEPIKQDALFLSLNCKMQNSNW